MNELRGKNVYWACNALDRAISKIFMMGASDPLASEAKGLANRLTQRFASLDCAATIAAKVAADKAEAARQAVAAAPPAPVENPYAKRDAIRGAISVELQSVSNSFEVAERWYDRGNDAESCGYYQEVLSSLRKLRSLYLDLYRETGDSDDSAESDKMRDGAGKVFESYGEMCVDAERRLY